MKSTGKESLINFYCDSSSWRVPALLSLIIFALSIYLKHHFYYIHFYLIAASIISNILSFRKYAQLTDSTLTIYNGIVGKHLKLNLNQIDSIEIDIKEVNGFAILGAWGGVPYKFKIDHIKINLYNPLANEEHTLINSRMSRNIHYRRLEVANDGLSLLLYESPKEGFRRFLYALSKSVKVLNLENVEYKSKYGDLIIAGFSLLMFGGFIILALIAIYRN